MYKKVKFEYKIVFTYLLIGALWIKFSDKLLDSFINDSNLLSEFQTYKGWFYVLITGVLFFFFLKKHLMKLRKVQADLVRNNHELNIAKEKIEESNKLKMEFLQNMSHEIRTPMNGIIGFSDILSEPNLSEESKKECTAVIQGSCKQLLKIIDNILEISKLSTKQVKQVVKEVNLNDLLTELFLIFYLNEKNIELFLTKGLSDRDSVILADEIRLKTILSNLLENAFKYTQKGFVKFGYEVVNDRIQFYVKDSGVGIDPKEQQSIFARFSQVEKELSQKQGGLGLGLSIVKESVELLGGDIWVESEKGEGAVFYVSIPFQPLNKIDELKRNSSKSIDSVENTYTILVAEDEMINFHFLEILLSDKIKFDCNILHAKNGKEAISICKSNPEIDLVLMDIKMPVVDGLEATRQIRRIRTDLPIIAQTAYSTDEDREKAISNGCVDLISKPIDVNLLDGLLNKYIVN